MTVIYDYRSRAAGEAVIGVPLLPEGPHVVECCGAVRWGRLAWCIGRGVVHLGLYCSQCGRWIKWLKQTPDVLAVAPKRPNEARAK